MKKLYFLLVIQFVFLLVNAAPVNKVVNVSAFWQHAGSWNLSRVPVAGDTVVIPTGKTLIISNTENFSGSTLYIKVYGTLVLNGGKLWLDGNSEIKVFTGGNISGSGSPSETIKIGGLTKFSGIQPPVLGPMLSNTSVIGFASFSDIPLGVKFVSFNVARKNNDVLIQWSTAEEINNSYYELQRSNDGITWNKIATVSGAGNTNVLLNYSFTDYNNTEKISYYRIKQADLDGKFTITGVRMIKNGKNENSISVNSSGEGKIFIHFAELAKSTVTVKVISMNGQPLFQNRYSNPFGQITLTHITTVKGIYIVTITDAEGMSYAKQVVL